MIRRVNFAREAGCDVPDSVRAGLITHRTHLMEDKATAEAKQRIEEAAAKAVAQEKAHSAPKMVMMKLAGHNDWVSWFHQAKELVNGITSKISKVQLIYNSLSNQ